MNAGGSFLATHVNRIPLMLVGRVSLQAAAESARHHQERGHTMTFIKLAPALFMSGDRQALGRDYLSSIASRHSIASRFGYIRASRGKNSGLPSNSVSTR